jgi:hypothetical protein
MRQLVDHGSGDREAPDAGVEDADGCVVHDDASLGRVAMLSIARIPTLAA